MPWASLTARRNWTTRTGPERELFIRKSNNCVVGVRLMAKGRGFVWTNSIGGRLSLIGGSK